MGTKSCDVLLLFVNDIEKEALRTSFEEQFRREPVVGTAGDLTYLDYGEVGGSRVFAMQTAMGSASPGGTSSLTVDAVHELIPGAIIAVGIAFGMGVQKKQPIGTILVSTRVSMYEPRKLGVDENGTHYEIHRGDRVTVPHRLLQRAKTCSGPPFWDGAAVQFGEILSGEKLVDDPDFKAKLKAEYPEAIGGEMEAAGIYNAAYLKKSDWIVIKGVSDYADGFKKRNKTVRQAQAARNAIRFVLSVLSRAAGIVDDAGTNSESAADQSRFPKATRARSKQNVNDTAKALKMETMPEPTVRDKLFISYAHEDAEWLKRVQRMLKPWIRKGGIDLWSDKDIRPGDRWRAGIEAARASTAVAVLLVSDYFLDSDFIHAEELGYFLDVVESDGIILIWVVVSDCMHEETPLAEYQAAFNPEVPLDKLSKPELNTAIKTLCQKIKCALNSVSPAPHSAPPSSLPSTSRPASLRALVLDGMAELLARMELRGLRQSLAAALKKPDEAATVAVGLCDLVDTNADGAFIDLHKAIKSTLQPAGVQAGDWNLICQGAVAAVGWLAVYMVSPHWGSQRPAEPWPEWPQNRLVFPLATEAGTEVLIANWRLGKAEFSLDKRHGGGRFVSAARLPEGGYGEGGAVDVIKASLWRELDMPGDPPTEFRETDNGKLRSALRIRREVHKEHRYIPVPVADLHHPLHLGGVYARLRRDLPELQAVFIDPGRGNDGGVFVLPERDLEIHIQQMLRTIRDVCHA